MSKENAVGYLTEALSLIEALGESKELKHAKSHATSAKIWLERHVVTAESTPTITIEDPDQAPAEPEPEEAEPVSVSSEDVVSPATPGNEDPVDEEPAVTAESEPTSAVVEEESSDG